MTDSPGATLLQTNKSTAPANSVLLDISSCQSAPSSNSRFSILCVRARNQCVIIFTLSLAGDIGARNGIEMTRSAQRGHGRSQTHSYHFLSLRRLFRSVPIQNLSRLYSTEVTHFQSTRLVSRKKRLAIRYLWFD